MSIFNSSSDIKMFDEQSFYRAFEKDLHLARRNGADHFRDSWPRAERAGKNSAG